MCVCGGGGGGGGVIKISIHTKERESELGGMLLVTKKSKTESTTLKFDAWPLFYLLYDYFQKCFVVLLWF